MGAVYYNGKERPWRQIGSFAAYILSNGTHVVLEDLNTSHWEDTSIC